jgi:16S rRNA (guanine527-N7)-methyltransferase
MRADERHALSVVLSEAAAQLPVRFAPEVQTQLLDYLVLLQKWNTVYNLTAVRDPVHMLHQHLLDCMATMSAFVSARRLLDVGSGGGLPGLVIAIWAQDSAPAMQIHLIDTVHKKTAFLTQAKAELGLRNVTVHTGRVEQLRDDEKFDVITSRAFAELSDFARWSAHLLAPGGEMIALKGQATAEEMARLPAEWRITRKTAVQVPGLNAQRHLVHIAGATGGDATAPLLHFAPPPSRTNVIPE